MKRTVLGSLLMLGLASGSLPLRQVAIAETVSPAQLAQQSRPPATTSPQTAPIQVTVLNPGTGDRQVLRFKPATGTRQLSLMTFEQSMSVGMAGQTVPAMNLPLVNCTIEFLVTRVDANGDIHYQFRYPEVDVVAKPGTEAALVEVMRSQMQTLRSIKGNFVMSDRGHVKSGRFELPDDTNPMLRQVLEQFSQSMNQLAFPLPEAAVGIGAKWQTTANISVGSMNLTQTGTYELVSLKNNVATLNVQVAQQAPPQTLNSPVLPSTRNTKIQLEQLQTEGAGQSTLDFSQPFVQQSSLAVRSQSRMSLSSPEGGRELEMTTQSTVKMTFQPKSSQPK